MTDPPPPAPKTEVAEPPEPTQVALPSAAPDVDVLHRQYVFAHGVRPRQITYNSVDAFIAKLYINTGNFGFALACFNGIVVDVEDFFLALFHH